MWAIYGYEYEEDDPGTGDGGYTQPNGFDAVGCGDGCTDCNSCKIKPYVPHILVGLGALLFFGVV